MFDSAKDFQINNSQFIDVAGDLHTHHVQNVQNNVLQAPGDVTAKAIKALAAHISADALHDSSARSVDTPRCHEGTRVAVKQDIMNWLSQPSSRESIEEQMMWVHGPAGTGKSAVMQDLSERCADERTLAASFFFSYASPTRTAATFLVPTLAYQIAQNVPCLREHIAAAVMKDPSVFEKDLGAQFAALILNPVDEALKQSPDLRDVLDGKDIFIDGLDECRWITAPRKEETWRDEEEKRRDLERRAEAAQTLVLTTLSSPQCPFQVVVASRPERAMRQFFRKESFKQIVLDNTYDPDTDIHLFLKASFRDIHAKYQMNSPWPSEEDIKQLVANASGQFVYASTVLRFVDDPDCMPEKHLATILSLKSGDADTPLSTLYVLYTSIIDKCISPMDSFATIRAFNFFKDAFCREGASEILSHEDASRLDLLYPIPPSTHERLFGRLHSLVRVPPPGAPRNMQDFNFYHKSLNDFLDGSAGSAHKPSNFLVNLLTMEWYLKACIHIQSTPSSHTHNLLRYSVFFFMGVEDKIDPYPDWEYHAAFERAASAVLTLAKQFDAAWWTSQTLTERGPDPTIGSVAHFNWVYPFFHKLRECRFSQCSPTCRRIRKEIKQTLRKKGNGFKVAPDASLRLRLARLRIWSLQFLLSRYLPDIIT